MQTTIESISDLKTVAWVVDESKVDYLEVPGYGHEPLTTRREVPGKMVEFVAGFTETPKSSRLPANISGPGCIWRIWSARAGDGHAQSY